MKLCQKVNIDPQAVGLDLGVPFKLSIFLENIKEPKRSNVLTLGLNLGFQIVHLIINMSHFWQLRHRKTIF